MDNTTVLHYITNMGGIKSGKCNNITGEIWNWCRQDEVWLSMMCIRSVDNIDADRLSKIFNERTEWMLVPRVFSKIQPL